MVSQKVLDTMKWWYEEGKKDAAYFESLVPSKLTQAECNYILGVV